MKSDSSAETPLLFTGTAVSLGFARFCIFTTWLVIVATSRMAELAELPSSLYAPAGLLRLFGRDFAESCHPHALRAFQSVICVILGILALGIRPWRFLAWMGIAGLVLFESWMKSYSSFINHGQLGILYAAIALAVFPSADALVLFRFKSPAPVPQTVHASGMAFTALVCGLAYALVGVRRLAVGPQVLWDGSLANWILSRTLEPLGYGFQWGMDVVRHPWLMAGVQLGFIVTTVFEILSPLTPFHDRLRRCWLAVMVPFHLLTLFTMNIFFWENLVLIAVYFTPLSYRLVPRWVGPREPP